MQKSIYTCLIILYNLLLLFVVTMYTNEVLPALSKQAKGNVLVLVGANNCVFESYLVHHVNTNTIPSVAKREAFQFLGQCAGSLKILFVCDLSKKRKCTEKYVKLLLLLAHQSRTCMFVNKFVKPQANVHVHRLV